MLDARKNSMLAFEAFDALSWVTIAEEVSPYFSETEFQISQFDDLKTYFPSLDESQCNLLSALPKTQFNLCPTAR